MFVLLDDGLPEIQLDQTRARPLPLENRASKNDLTLDIQATGETWSCGLEYAADLFSPESTAGMAGHFSELLQSITEHPEKAISALNLMPLRERQQVLVEWNQTHRQYPRTQC